MDTPTVASEPAETIFDTPAEAATPAETLQFIVTHGKVKHAVTIELTKTVLDLKTYLYSLTQVVRGFHSTGVH